MFFSKKALEFASDAAAANAKAALLYAQVLALQTTVDWMRVRVNQLEHERAVLVENYMGVKIQVPTIEPAPEAPRSVESLLGQSLDFNDVGDRAAAALGLGWNDNGECVKLSEIK